MSETYLHLIVSRVTNDELRHYEEEQLKEDEAETEEEIELMKTKPFANFLKGMNDEDVNSSLGMQLNQMLRKYTLRKIRLEQREKEVSTIYRYIKFSSIIIVI